jgi:pheromone shutdown-related protein TraB
MLKQIGNIYLLGTSHVSKESVSIIKKTISEIQPEVVAIELDYHRLKSLLSKQQKKPSFFQLVKEYGVFGAGFLTMASSFQKKMGKKLQILPGEDMKTAYECARKESIPTILIDQHIKKTITNLSRISTLSKCSMVFNLLIKSFKKEYRVSIEHSLGKGNVPSEKTLEFIMNIIKKEAPEFYRVIISDRDHYMAHKLLQLQEKHSGPILAVVGAGHLKGMVSILEQTPLRSSTVFQFTTDEQPFLNLNFNN